MMWQGLTEPQHTKKDSKTGGVLLIKGMHKCIANPWACGPQRQQGLHSLTDNVAVVAVHSMGDVGGVGANTWQVGVSANGLQAKFDQHMVNPEQDAYHVMV
jgi:hypothetical protein